MLEKNNERNVQDDSCDAHNHDDYQNEENM